MWHTCQLIMIVSLDIINSTCNQIRCHSLGFCNVTGTFIYFKTIKLAIATTLVVNVRVPFNFTTWNKVVYTSGYVITYIIKPTEPNHLILILNLANKSYFIIKVNFCHLLACFKNYDPLKVELILFGTRCSTFNFYNPYYSYYNNNGCIAVFVMHGSTHWRKQCGRHLHKTMILYRRIKPRLLLAYISARSGVSLKV